MKERITAETIADSARRQEELRLLLKEMARICLEEEDEQISVFASQLRELYIPSFRHRYSEFFPMLVEIDEEESELGLDFLSTNIRKVRKYVERKCAAGDTTYDSLYKPMMKLSDHLSLEIARYSHFISQNRQIMDLTDKHQDLQAQLAETTERLHEATAKLDQANDRFSTTETKLKDAEAKLQTIETDLPTATTDLNTVKKSLASIHIDIIAVLSIFASIVLTFAGFTGDMDG